MEIRQNQTDHSGLFLLILLNSLLQGWFFLSSSFFLLFTLDSAQSFTFKSLLTYLFLSAIVVSAFIGFVAGWWAFIMERDKPKIPLYLKICMLIPCLLYGILVVLMKT